MKFKSVLKQFCAFTFLFFEFTINSKTTGRSIPVTKSSSEVPSTPAANGSINNSSAASSEMSSASISAESTSSPEMASTSFSVGSSTEEVATSISAASSENPSASVSLPMTQSLKPDFPLPGPPPPPVPGQLYTLQQLSSIYQDCEDKCTLYLDSLKGSMLNGLINTCPRQSAFLAQIGEECGQLKFMEELGSDAYFEQMYGGRAYLGNVFPGDGARYKGRGAIQITGRNNYRNCGNDLNRPYEDQPTLVAQQPDCFDVAVWFWNTHGLSDLADQNTQEAFDQITLRINGGFNGKPTRDSLWGQAKVVLGC